MAQWQLPGVCDHTAYRVSSSPPSASVCALPLEPPPMFIMLPIGAPSVAISRTWSVSSQMTA